MHSSASPHTRDRGRRARQFYMSRTAKCVDRLRDPSLSPPAYTAATGCSAPQPAAGPRGPQLGPPAQQQPTALWPKLDEGQERSAPGHHRLSAATAARSDRLPAQMGTARRCQSLERPVAMVCVSLITATRSARGVPGSLRRKLAVPLGFSTALVHIGRPADRV